MPNDIADLVKSIAVTQARAIGEQYSKRVPGPEASSGDWKCSYCSKWHSGIGGYTHCTRCTMVRDEFFAARVAEERSR